MQMSYFRELLKLDVFSILPAAYDHFFKLWCPKLFLFFVLDSGTPGSEWY